MYQWQGIVKLNKPLNNVQVEEQVYKPPTGDVGDLSSKGKPGGGDG